MLARLPISRVSLLAVVDMNDEGLKGLRLTAFYRIQILLPGAKVESLRFTLVIVTRTSVCNEEG